MLKRTVLTLAAAAALAAAAPAAPALAEHRAPTLRIELGVHDAHYRGGHRYRQAVTRYEAIQIARRHGIARVTDVDLVRGVWHVSGRSHRGVWIDVDVAARTGRVLDVDYGRGRGRGFGHRRGDRRIGYGW